MAQMCSFAAFKRFSDFFFNINYFFNRFFLSSKSFLTLFISFNYNYFQLSVTDNVLSIANEVKKKNYRLF